MSMIPTPIRRFMACTSHGGAPLAVLVRASRTIKALDPLARAVERRLARYSERSALAFDRKHGTDTWTRVQFDNLGLKDANGNRHDKWGYSPICPAFSHEMMRQIPRRGELTLYDIGSGKGLALILAGDHGFRRIVGIELAEDLCEVSRRNFENYAKSTGRAVNAELIAGDFMRAELPNEPTVFFLNNPFPAAIAELAMAHIERSIEANPRRVLVAYRYPNPVILQRLRSSVHLRNHLSTPYWHIFTTV
jgi:hypothetical protein